MPFDPKKAQFLTDAGTVRRDEIVASVPGMAHFAGTGPSDKTCGDCLHWQSMPKRSTMHCSQYVTMTGDRRLKPVPSLTWACRYFVARGSAKHKT